MGCGGRASKSPVRPWEVRGKSPISPRSMYLRKSSEYGCNMCVTSIITVRSVSRAPKPIFQYAAVMCRNALYTEPRRLNFRDNGLDIDPLTAILHGCDVPAGAIRNSIKEACMKPRQHRNAPVHPTARTATAHVHGKKHDGSTQRTGAWPTPKWLRSRGILTAKTLCDRKRYSMRQPPPPPSPKDPERLLAGRTSCRSSFRLQPRARERNESTTQDMSRTCLACRRSWCRCRRHPSCGGGAMRSGAAKVDAQGYGRGDLGCSGF